MSTLTTLMLSMRAIHRPGPASLPTQVQANQRPLRAGSGVAVGRWRVRGPVEMAPGWGSASARSCGRDLGRCSGRRRSTTSPGTRARPPADEAVQRHDAGKRDDEQRRAEAAAAGKALTKRLLAR
jgi:hypothetical protein